MKYRLATTADAAILARLNAELIADERHRNAMSPSELERRMAEWLARDYAAVLFLCGEEPVGYALYRTEPDHVYLRQFFVCRSSRRMGVGRAAIAWLRQNSWPMHRRIRVDVLMENSAAISFWRSVGFADYCLTMETAAEGS